MLLKSTIAYAPSVLAPRLAAFAVVLVLTRLLPVGEYGLYALTIVVAEVLDMTCSSWIRLAQLRLDSARPRSLVRATMRSLLLTTIAVLAGVAASFAVSPVLVPDRYAEFGLAVGCYVIANGVIRLGITVLRMRGKAVACSVIETSRALSLCAAAILAVRLIAPNFLVASLAVSCTTLLFGVATYVLSLNRLHDSAADSATYRDRLRFGIPVIFLMATTYFFASSDRTMLQMLGGPAALGVYAAAYALARQPIEAVANAINQGSFPELVRRYETGGVEQASVFLGQTLVLLLALVLPAVFLLVALDGPIVHLLLPHSYRQVGPQVLPYVAIGTVCLYVKSFVLDQVFYLVRKNWLQVATFLPALASAVIAGLFLIPRFGAVGAAQTMCMSNFVGLTTSFLVSGMYIRPVIRTEQISGLSFRNFRS